MSDAEELRAIRTAKIAEYKRMAADPNYSVDGQSVNKADNRKVLLEEIRDLGVAIREIEGDDGGDVEEHSVLFS